jgi:hypothetical protein
MSKKITWKKRKKRMTCEQYMQARIEANRKKAAESHGLPDWLTKDAPTLERELLHSNDTEKMDYQ